MPYTITDEPGLIKFSHTSGEDVLMNKSDLNIKKGLFFVYVTNGEGFVNTHDNEVLRIRYTEVSSPSFASNSELITWLQTAQATTGVVNKVIITDGSRDTTLEPNGSLPVTIQDQVTPIIITKFSLLEEATTTTGAVAIDDYVIPVTSVTGIITGKYLSIFDPTSVRFSNFYVVSVASLNVTVDRPIDFAYPSGSYVDVQDANLAVNGSVTPVTFGIRNNAGAVPPPGLELSVDITRIIIQCITATAVDYDLFGDIAALTYGITLRNRNGDTHNIFNVKTTGELAGITFDLDVHDVKQGTDGFISRLTFAGQSKMGAVQRLAIDEDLELIINDDLSGLTKFEITAEGSVVQP